MWQHKHVRLLMNNRTLPNSGLISNYISYHLITVAPTITTPVEGQQFSITEGSNGSITCTATGYPVPRVAWSTSMQRNANRLIVGDPVVSSTGVGNETSVSVELMVIGAKRVDTGLYRCSANDDVAIADVAIIIQCKIFNLLAMSTYIVTITSS